MPGWVEPVMIDRTPLPTLSLLQPSLVTVSRLWLVIDSWMLEPIPEVVLEHYCLWAC